MQVLEGELPERTGYRRASDSGLSATETRFETLNEKADRLTQSLVDKITKAKPKESNGKRSETPPS